MCRNPFAKPMNMKAANTVTPTDTPTAMATAMLLSNTTGLSPSVVLDTSVVVVVSTAGIG